MIFEFEGLVFGVVLPLVIIEHLFKRVLYKKTLIQVIGPRRSGYYWNGVLIGVLIDVVFIVYVCSNFSKYMAELKNWL